MKGWNLPRKETELKHPLCVVARSSCWRIISNVAVGWLYLQAVCSFRYAIGQEIRLFFGPISCMYNLPMDRVLSHSSLIHTLIPYLCKTLMSPFHLCPGLPMVNSFNFSDIFYGSLVSPSALFAPTGDFSIILSPV